MAEVPLRRRRSPSATLTQPAARQGWERSSGSPSAFPELRSHDFPSSGVYPDPDPLPRRESSASIHRGFRFPFRTRLRLGPRERRDGRNPHADAPSTEAAPSGRRLLAVAARRLLHGVTCEGEEQVVERGLPHRGETGSSPSRSSVGTTATAAYFAYFVSRSEQTLETTFALAP
jgi:hypothetical protein